MVVNKWLFVIDRMFYLVIVWMVVIVYCDIDWIIGELDMLFIVYVKVRDVVIVYFIVLVVIGNDIRSS